VQSTLGVGGCGNICFGHVLVALRQGQRRDTIATGEERFGRCTAGQIKYILLYLYSGKLILAAMYLRRVCVDGRSVAAGAPALTGQRAARCEVQKHKPTTANDPRTITPRRLLISVYRIGRDGGKMPPPVTTQNTQFYVQRSSGFCWIPPVVRRLLK
jgi:hypothetical protein